MSDLPLAGVRVLDLSRQLPGPLATQLLADFGADVIKIEDTRAGDNFRTAAPLQNGIATRHLMLNRNKRGLAVDLKSDAGREIFFRLAARSQVVLEQFRPGVVKRLGIEYEAVRARNPGIVYCSLSGFGQESPYRNLAAHDPNYLALSGVLSLIGAKDREPALSGPQLADLSASHMVAIGILIALRRAEATGRGDYIDISLFDSALSLATTALATYFGSGRAPSRGEERHNGKYPWADIYRTADGGYITLCAIEAHFYRNLCLALGRPEWVALQYAEEAQQEAIRTEMRRIFLTRTRDAWFELLKDKDVCIGPVLTLEEAVQSPQVAGRGTVVAHRHAVAGDTQQLATPIRLRECPASIRSGAPALGEHTADILRSLGYGEGDVERLQDQGVIAMPPDDSTRRREHGTP